MYLIPFVVVFLLAFWFIYHKQIQNMVRPLKCYADYTGAPHYIAGSTSGSPLSELGSHCGFKSVSERKAASCYALFATITSFAAGRLLDFATCLYSDKGQTYFKSPGSRRIKLSPYCIEEWSDDDGFQQHSRLYFLQRNLVVLETEWKARANSVRVKPACYVIPTVGRDLENPYPHFNGFSFYGEKGSGLQFSNYHRLPGQKFYAYFLPSSGGVSGKKEIQGSWFDLKPGEKACWSVIISFSADEEKKIVKRAERALRNLERLKAGAAKRWDRFELKLPTPYETSENFTKEVLRLAAWALQNNLYYPRGKMKFWGSVPSKVYFPFIWGWDTPQHVLGLSEWNPRKAGDVLLTQLDANYFAPRNARFKLKIKGITFISGSQRNLIPSKLNDCLRGVLDFYSQPPLQSWAAVRVYERFKQSETKELFLHRVLPPLKHNLAWWEENRRLKNGFFSYINGLESGLDDSPRFYPPSFLPSFIIGVVPRFFSAVDLNCWLYQSYINTAYLCREAGQDENAKSYFERGLELKERIDQELWSPDHGAWLDRRNGKFIKVITPSVWWPAFVGAGSDLEKVKAVIEKYLLDPSKFWGSYGIPSVAFDDKAYNRRKDGYYWRGQIWMINNYSALEVLFRFGYTEEAEELHKRIMKTLYASRGLFETYNAENGKVGWSSRGPGDPAVMQFGMSSGWATQMLFFRYQHFRYIFPETREISGHIQWAAAFDHQPLLSPPSVEENPSKAMLSVRTEDGHAYDVPKLFLQSRDDRPLHKSSLLSLHFEDPAGCLQNNACIIFTWRGESYRVRTGKNYLLRPQSRYEKLSSA